ncbi:hypothetical protein [Aliamphritea spongicola]|uniref:hypothetical protein n=1 Tax=Aliamphritea spongicola TaxID=707589 RepID=UPI00196B0920|nr:hypothetical protein [Aliamphritea spongicola]MBN3562132.1 hypothetical protein [Aliamphritea spongicola]
MALAGFNSILQAGLSALLAMLLAGAAVAAEERPLSGAEIQQLLAGKTAYLDNGAVQTFSSNGKTLYFHEPRPLETGTWKTDGNEYCSEWGGRWSCYKMTGDGADRITWIGGGTTYPARLEAGNIFE